MRKNNSIYILFTDQAKRSGDMVEGHGINDMYWGWASENEWNRMVYKKWASMLYRCYNEEYHQTKKGECYIGCSVCERWLTLSNFVEDFKNIDGYDEERFLNGELVLDKDIKSGKRGEKNKQYIMIECLLTTQEENSKEAMRTRDYSDIRGRELSEEHKRKLSENARKPNKGKFGSEHPNSKKIVQYNKQTHELIKIWDSMMDVERELGIAQQNISECCKGKRKSAGGFIWKYVEGEESGK